MIKLINVVGARPNFMKIAPIINALNEYNSNSNSPIKHLLVHTGQHYDKEMSKLFFEELEIPRPDIDLDVGSASHAEQTAEIMKRFEKVCLKEEPTHVLVVGDVNSTIACALVASKLNIKIIHIEAGLRSFDRTMPEEINRILTDAISDYLFITEKSAEENLLREGADREKLFFVGNVMIDTLLKHREKARASLIHNKLGLKRNSSENSVIAEYGVLTLHRPSNVDDKKTFRNILDALIEISKDIPIVFPAHPRTKRRIQELGFEDCFIYGGLVKTKGRGIYCIEPLGYLDFLALMSEASLVLTDSGGIQEEATVLGVPCVTLRENTERPVTVTEGTNIIAGTIKDNIIGAAVTSMNNRRVGKTNEVKAPPLWDGGAARRIVEVLAKINNQ